MPDILTVNLGELLGAYQLGIVTKNEARSAMGFEPLDEEQEGN